MVLSVMLAAASAVQQPPVAQPAQAQSDQTIVITGERDGGKTVRDFVRALTPVGSAGQISRFERSVCPVVFGLPQRQAGAVAARMRRVAQGAGILAGGPSCSPNVVVLVTADKKGLLRELLRQQPGYFDDLAPAKIRAILRQPGPAAAWQLQGPPVNSRGVEVQADAASGLPTNRTTDAGSRLTAPARPQFDAAVVVVESSALAGLTVTQLADYAAMRAFSGADPVKLASAGAPTILRVLEAPIGSEVPITMTRWDFGFLRGLYTANRNVHTGAQRSQIAGTIAKDLEGTER